ncbi:MAG: hypothetical protein HEQ11_20325 [Gemmatimonas sp.]
MRGESGVAVLADARYVTVDSIDALHALLTRVREVPYIAIDTETITDADAPYAIDAMRAQLVGLSIAVMPGEAYYLPFRHRRDDGGGNLALLSGDAGIAGQRINAGAPEPVNLPPFGSAECAPLRAMLEDASVKKIAQNAKYDVLVLRGAGVRMAGLEFDTMLASYVLDPGRRSHGTRSARAGVSGTQHDGLRTAVRQGQESAGLRCRAHRCGARLFVRRCRCHDAAAPPARATAGEPRNAVAAADGGSTARVGACRYGVRRHRHQFAVVRKSQDALQG